MLGWWIVHTVVLPVATIFFTVRITTAAALASKPEVGSSMNIMEGFETSSTAIVSLFLCSVDSPLLPGIPTKESLISSSSIVSMTSCTNFYKAMNINTRVQKNLLGGTQFNDVLPLWCWNLSLEAALTRRSIAQILVW